MSYININGVRRIIEVPPSPPDDRDHIADEKLAPTLAPKEIDPRKKLLSVRDQGSQGTCVAQTAACIKEIHENKESGLFEYMSPQFIYNLREYNGSGMYPRTSMKILYKTGSVLEKQFPYEEYVVKGEGITEGLKEKAKKYRIKEYGRVNSVEAGKKAIATSGAFLISVPVYNYTEKMWQHEDGQEKLGNHAMTAVGYNSEGFIIRNSWGNYWGDNGYTIFPYDDWGKHNEAWSAIDLLAGQKRSLPRWFWIIIGVVGGLAAIAGLIILINSLYF